MASDEDGELEVLVESVLPVAEGPARGLGLGGQHGLEDLPVPQRAELRRLSSAARQLAVPTLARKWS